MIETEKTIITPAVPPKTIRRIETMLAQFTGLPKDYIGCSPGPGETLDILFKMLIKPGIDVLIIGPSDKNIKEIVQNYGGRVEEFFEREPFLPDPAGMIERINYRTKIVLLGNPNTYSGTVYSLGEIEDILMHADGFFLVLDETTIEFSGISAVDLIEKYDNLVIIRNIPGDQANTTGATGYIISDPNNISQFYQYVRESDTVEPDEISILSTLECPRANSQIIRQIKEQMLSFSLRLRNLGFENRLAPHGALLIQVTCPDKVLSLLRSTGIKEDNMSFQYGNEEYILLKAGSAVDIELILALFEEMADEYIHESIGGRRVIIRRHSERAFDNNYIKAADPPVSGKIEKEPVRSIPIDQ